MVENPPGLSVADAIGRYKSNPNVLYAEPDFAVSTTDIPADPMWSQQWDMQKISAPAAWDINTSANDVIVAVIDTGVDFTHADLKANLWTNPAGGSHGFTCMNGACTVGGLDDYGHGTHVAGTIGASANNGIGVAGINWRTQILSCKFLGSNGSGNISDAVLCFNQVLALKQQGFNIRVTSNSWGGAGFSQALKDAMSAVEAAGIVNVCAAGNSGVNTDMAPMYPGAYDNRGLVSVLATDSSDLGAYFTNYGVATVDIAAPGVSTLSTVPTGTCSLCDPSGYKLLSGTSMATPHVSGVMAAMLHINPALSAYEARDAVLDPGSYDALTDERATMTSTGGRLNLLKAITNPFLSSPKLNNFPTLSTVPNVFANPGDMINLTASASDPDGDAVHTVWQSPGFAVNSLWLMSWGLNQIFPMATGESVSFQAPSLARTVTAPYAVSVSDGKGGSATEVSYTTILPGSNPGGAPSGNLVVSPTSGPVGTIITVDNQAVDPEGGPVAWDFWMSGFGGASGVCCKTAPYTFPINGAGAFRISSQAVNKELQFSNRISTVVHIGGATGTPPIVAATFDKLSGTVPLTVNIDMKASTDPDGTIQAYVIICDYATSGVAYAGPIGSCTYDTPGTHWILLQIKDNDGLTDLLSAYAVVTPPSTGPSKSPASVTLSNMTQPYTGSALKPTATTNPPGLAIAWTNAPQTSPGTYSITATVNDPTYQGSAGGTFTITNVKANATVTLSNLTQTYTGSPLQPTVTTSPAGLSIIWSNAPQTQAGTYAVTASVNDPNYTGSASGTFVINKASASVTLGNLSQNYTGSALTPTATTKPAGLSIAWTNAPQTKAGTYAVTATVNDPNYQGSANGTFTITTVKTTASVTLSNLTQTYTGSALTPTATTNPPGLAISWTNAPQTNAGSYAITATVNDPNYTGSATGTFTIVGSAQPTPPAVAITSPTAGTLSVGTVNIQASVTKGTNPIAHVDFSVNGTLKCTVTAAPYACSWKMPGAIGKSYQLQAQAYDSAGLTGTSTTVTVTSKK
jgi:subtilisin family serine protease